ncbi:hypothetical protein ACFO3J_27805 [Streptomyces polygonati]|uniref:Secreted protein n=1 Tax=Streptomyces polygonati TaxID=1617087 RepID=A0ABV8HVX8_9ACTN
MRKFTKAATGTAVTGAALIAAIGLAAAPAFASVNQAVVSGSPSGGVITATATTPTLTDNTTGAKLTCTSASATGSVLNGVYTAGAPTAIKVGTITKAAWSTCKLNSITFTVTAGTLPWNLLVTGVTASGSTPVSLTGVSAKLTGLCTATITGSVTGSFVNSSHTLSITGGSLSVSGVGGLCLGLINNGDSITYKANYVLASTAPVVVTAT